MMAEAAATAFRFAGVSATTTRTWSTPESLILSVIRRICPCASMILDSPSTGSPSPASETSTKPAIQASHARASPGRGNGTSSRMDNLGCKVARKRLSNRTCPASRRGSGPAYVWTRTSSPTTAPIRATCPMPAVFARPRSMREIWDAEMPTASLTLPSDKPALTLARRNSTPTPARSERARRAPRSTGRSRVGTEPVCRLRLTSHSTRYRPALAAGNPVSSCACRTASTS